MNRCLRCPNPTPSMSIPDLQTLVDELVVRGTDDWVMAADVAWIITDGFSSSSEEQIFETSLGVIRIVLDRGLMEVGDVTDEGFVPWELPAHEALTRVEHKWRELGRFPDLGEVCWLANTDLGDERAGRVLSRRTE